jgi:hypothetical protein
MAENFMDYLRPVLDSHFHCMGDALISDRSNDLSWLMPWAVPVRGWQYVWASGNASGRATTRKRRNMMGKRK